MFCRRMHVISVISIVAALATCVAGDPIGVTLVPADFASLLGGSASPIGSPMLTPLSGGNLVSEAVSQAFTDGSGHYVYLYQPVNTGVAGNNAADAFTIGPFFGAGANVVMGYLTGSVPPGFSLGDRLSAGASVDVSAGPTIVLGYPGWLGGALNPGQSSKTYYVLSDVAPGLITGNMIDHSVASSPVVGPAPEPATLALLALGGLLLRRPEKACLSFRQL